MSNAKIQLRLPKDMKEAATRQAAMSRISLNLFVATAVAARVGAQAEAERYFAARGRADNAGPREGVADKAWNGGGRCGMMTGLEGVTGRDRRSECGADEIARKALVNGMTQLSDQDRIRRAIAQGVEDQRLGRLVDGEAVLARIEAEIDAFLCLEPGRCESHSHHGRGK
jgi:hypothetical protein